MKKHTAIILAITFGLLTGGVVKADESRKINQETKEGNYAPEYVEQVNAEKQFEDAQSKQTQRKHRKLIEKAANRR
jgi:hypothetical protein